MAKQRSTIHIDGEVWQLAKLKAESKHMSLSSVIENFLIDYVGYDYCIEEYREKIEECRQKIVNAENNIEAYNKAIKEINDEMEANGKNEVIIGECLERIRRRYSYDKIISMVFLKTLSKSQKVPIDVLKRVCKIHDIPISGVNMRE